MLGALLQIFVGLVVSEWLSIELFNNNEYSLHIKIVLCSSAINFLNNLFFMLLRFKRKSLHVVLINFMNLVLSCIIIIVLLDAGFALLAPVTGLVISNAVVFCFLVYFVKDDIGIKCSIYEFKVQLPFGFQAVIIGLAYLSFDSLNRFFINKYCSLSDVGIYSLGYQVSMAINILFVLPFSQIWAPMRMEYRYDDNADEFYRKILTYYVVIGLMVLVVVSLFAKEILILLGGHEEYIEAYRVVPYIMTGLLIYGSVNIIDYGIYFSRKIIYHAYIFGFVSFFAFLMNVLFVDKFGFIAAAMIIMVCYSLTAFLVFYVSNKLYRVPFETHRIVSTLVVCYVSLIAGSCGRFDDIYYCVFYKVMVVLNMTALIWKIVLNSNEKMKIASCLKMSLLIK